MGNEQSDNNFNNIENINQLQQQILNNQLRIQQLQIQNLQNNNQNTSTSRELTSVFFTPVAAGRNSDIWTSYIICKLVETSKDVVAFGAPYVKQFRNPHNLWTDLKDELPNNILTDYFD